MATTRSEHKLVESPSSWRKWRNVIVARSSRFNPPRYVPTHNVSSAPSSSDVTPSKLNGVRTVYGVVGIPITDVARVAQASGIRYIGFRHESDAGHAAAAAGFVTKQQGICLTASAPAFLKLASTNGNPF